MSLLHSSPATNLVDPVSRTELVPSSSAGLPHQTIKTPGVRRRSSIREIIFQKIPEKLFKKSNQSEIFLPTSTNFPPPEPKPSLDIDMKRSRPMAITTSKETEASAVPPNNPSPTGRLD